MKGLSVKKENLKRKLKCKIFNRDFKGFVKKLSKVDIVR